MPRKTKQDPKRIIQEEVGRRIREARTARGLTQQVLARAVRISVAYMSLIERGGRNPPVTTIVVLARALKMPTGELVPA